MCAVRDFNNSLPEGQQKNTDTWPPCTRCGAPAPLKTQYGDLCERCYVDATDQALKLATTSDVDLCQMVAKNSAPDGDRFLILAAVREIEARCLLRAGGAR